MTTAEAEPQAIHEQKATGGRERPGMTARRALRQTPAPLLALLLALGSLAYYALVYAPSVAESDRAQGYTGYSSDLYSRWYGTRELLLNGRDPYSAEITAEMQRAFVGRDPLPGEQMPEWAVFAQPLYTVFVLAPLAPLDFELAQSLATVIFPLMIGLGTLFWLATPGVPLTWPRLAVAALLALSAPATLYAADFQQLSAPVFLMLAVSFLLLTRRRYAWAGAALALSTIKPQESWLLIGLLLGWALFDLRERRGLLWGFAGSMALLLIAAEALLPGWILKFAASLARYSEQTSELQLFGALLPAPALAGLAAGWLALLAWLTWRVRHEPANSSSLAVAAAGALAITVVMIPAYLQYERIYLLPALTALLWGVQGAANGRVGRLLRGIALPLMLAPWALAALLGCMQLAGVPVIQADATFKALPWVPYALLAQVAAPALVPLLAGSTRRRMDEQRNGRRETATQVHSR